MAAVNRSVLGELPRFPRRAPHRRLKISAKSRLRPPGKYPLFLGVVLVRAYVLVALPWNVAPVFPIGKDRASLLALLLICFVPTRCAGQATLLDKQAKAMASPGASAQELQRRASMYK